MDRHHTPVENGTLYVCRFQVTMQVCHLDRSPLQGWWLLLPSYMGRSRSVNQRVWLFLKGVMGSIIPCASFKRERVCVCVYV